MIKDLIKKKLQKTFPKLFITNIQLNISLPQSEGILRNRTALITGGTSGIGFSIAKFFLMQQASVVITGRDKNRVDSAVEKLKKIIQECGDVKVFGYVLNNKGTTDFEKPLNEIVSFLSKAGIPSIDILVNNAGVNGASMPNVTREDYDDIMNTNLRGTFFLSQAVGKYFVGNNIHGNILNVASASSLRPANSPYVLSKWGIRALTLGLAKSLGNKGVTVNGIAPGPTATPMMIHDGNCNMTRNSIPLGRYITPEEIATMAVMLVSDNCRSIMGDIVYMTGGAGLLSYDDVKYDF